MKCTNCGAELSPGDKFCGACGAPGPSATDPLNLPERGQDSPQTTSGPPTRTDVPPTSAMRGHVPPPLPEAKKRRRKLPLFVLGLLALGAVIAIGGALAFGLGVVRIDSLLPRRGVGSEIVPQEQTSVAAFQAAAKECQPIAGIAPIHEGVDMDVLVRVEGRVGENCRIYQEVIRDGTGRGMTGKSMTCLIPMESLLSGRVPDAPLKDHCSGSLVDAIERQAQEEE